jgi:pimeloyl-ACP methyl ester carboxylesterase
MQKTNLAGAVDGSRIALWGVSYSGGHVLVTAAKFGDRVKAVVANVSCRPALQLLSAETAAAAALVASRAAGQPGNSMHIWWLLYQGKSTAALHQLTICCGLLQSAVRCACGTVWPTA